MAREDALDQALALLGNRDLRHRFRGMPLPHGVAALLAVVGGEPERLRQAATARMAEPTQLLQAARQYVLEVMLFPGADDRRLLGLADDAEPAAMKAHYRALLSWLHPDRIGPDAAANVQAVHHAARINAAWHRLRAGTPTAAIRVPRWQRVEPDGGGRGRRWWLGGAIAAIAGGWLWLAWLPPTRTSLPPAEQAGHPPGIATSFSAALQGGRMDTTTPTPTPAVQTPPAPDNAPAAAAVAEPLLARLWTRPEDHRPAPAVPEPLPDLEPEPTRHLDTPEPATRPGGSPVVLAATAAIATPAAAPWPAAAPARQYQPRTAPAPAPSAVASVIDPVADIAAVPHLDGREQLAQARAGELLAWLTRQQDTPPPIWRSGQALDAALDVRQALAEAGGRRRPQVLHAQAHWRIEPEQARLQVPVQAAPRQPPHLLQASLQWRDGAWWVQSVALEPTP